MENKRLEINELGEFGLIERIRAKFPKNHPRSICGIGDDAAVLDAGAAGVVVPGIPLRTSSRSAPTAPITPDASVGRKIVEPLPSASFGSASRYLRPRRYIAA